MISIKYGTVTDNEFNGLASPTLIEDGGLQRPIWRTVTSIEHLTSLLYIRSTVNWVVSGCSLNVCSVKIVEQMKRLGFNHAHSMCGIRRYENKTSPESHSRDAQYHKQCCVEHKSMLCVTAVHDNKWSVSELPPSTCIQRWRLGQSCRQWWGFWDPLEDDSPSDEERWQQTQDRAGRQPSLALAFSASTHPPYEDLATVTQQTNCYILFSHEHWTEPNATRVNQ